MQEKVSRRISQLQPSPTITLNSKAKALKQEGCDVLNFSVGEPDFNTPKVIVDAAIEALNSGATRYGPSGGSLDLRVAISNKLKKENNLSYDPDQIVCGIGAKEILFHTFLAICNEGDEVILPAPYWVSYKDQVLAAGATPIIVPLAEDYQSKQLNIEGIKNVLSPKTKAIVVNSPNNPAGFIYSKEQLQELGDLIFNQDLWLISDEIYEYLAFDHEHISILNQCPGLESKTILINGLSKAFAMTGFRVGYGAGPKQVMQLVKRLVSHSSSCIPPFIDKAAVTAVESGKELMLSQIQDLKVRRDFIESEMSKALPELGYIKPQGAFYLFIDIRKFLAASSKFAPMNTMAFCEWLLEKYFMAMVPGEVFGVPGFIRMSYATDKETITKGIQRLSEAINEK